MLSCEVTFIRILLTCILCEIRSMVRVENTRQTVFSSRVVCPYLSSRTLPARIRQDPASRTMQDIIIRSYELRDVMS